MAQNGNILEQFYEHFIKETNGDPIPFSLADKVQIALEVLGASAGIYAWPPAAAYAKDKAAWLLYVLVVTNPMSNVLFLVKATDDMLKKIEMEYSTPKSLAIWLNSMPAKALLSKYTKLILGSIVCALSFAIATLLFPLPGCTSHLCLAVITTHSLLANTILHAISWSFMLTPAMWYYRIPFLPFEKAYALIKYKSSSQDEQKEQKIDQKIQAIYDKYRYKINTFFISNIRNIINEYGRRASTLPLAKLKYTDASLLSLASTASLHQPFLASSGEKHIPRTHRAQYCFNSILPLISDWGVGIIGATFMLVGTSGWVTNPIYLASTKLNLSSVDSLLLGGLPAYSTGILCAFYGAATIKQILAYVTQWRPTPHNSFSIEARLYPMLFALLLITNLFLSAFAYGTGEELVLTVFASNYWDEVRPFLKIVTIPALQILSFVPLLNLINTVLHRFVAKLAPKHSKHREVCRLLTKLEILPERLNQIKGGELINAIASYKEDALNTLGISHTELASDQAKLTGLFQERETQANRRLARNSMGTNLYITSPTG